MDSAVQTSTSPLSSVILLAALVCIVGLCTASPARVFRNVVLPVVLISPLYFHWKIKLLPPVDFAEAVLWPLGMAMAIRSMARWRFSWIDLWVILFVVSSGAFDLMHGQTTDGAFELFDSIGECLIPYMAGKLLIEQDNGRVPFMRRAVMLLTAISVIAMIEWKLDDNPFHRAFEIFFSDQIVPWKTQIRDGHGRISGPFASGELAGMMFLFALLLGIFLARFYGWGTRIRKLRSFPLRKSSVAAAIFLMALYLTQSRGPELALLFAAPIAWIGRTRHVARNAVVVAAIMLVGGSIAFNAITRYAEAGAHERTATDEQETAAYRVLMVQIYVPIAEAGGAFGLGPEFKPVGKYASIDNQYLLVWLTQGYVGILSFVLIGLGTIYRLLQGILHNAQKVDRALAFTLLGIFCGILITVATVFLGMQPLIVFFLLAGWAQAVWVRPAKQPVVFQQVYT